MSEEKGHISGEVQGTLRSECGWRQRLSCTARRGHDNNSVARVGLLSAGSGAKGRGVVCKYQLSVKEVARPRLGQTRLLAHLLSLCWLQPLEILFLVGGCLYMTALMLGVSQELPHNLGAELGNSPALTCISVYWRASAYMGSSMSHQTRQTSLCPPPCTH